MVPNDRYANSDINGKNVALLFRERKGHRKSATYVSLFCVLLLPAIRLAGQWLLFM